MFKYNWKNREANFGPPIPSQVKDGTHVTVEIILRNNGSYIALRRPAGIPEHETPAEGSLYFCHNLIRYGETVENCVSRIVKDQAGVSVKKMRTVYVDSELQKKDGQWAITLHVIAETKEKPSTSEKVTEVIEFDKSNVPEGFARWRQEELAEFLEEFG